MSIIKTSGLNHYNTFTVTSTTTDASDIFSNPQMFQVKMPSINWTAAAKKEPSGGIYSDYVTQEMLVYYPRTGKDYTERNQNLGPGALPFVNVRELLARFFIHTYFHAERVKNWRGRCIGITSMLDKKASNYLGEHMPMFDYDGNVKKKIRKDVAAFQDKYGLGDAWVYRTKKGYHVYFFCDNVPYAIYMQMLGEAQCCTGFGKQTTDNGFAVLRISAKYTRFDIELEYILKSKNTSVVKRPLKKAHVIQELIGMGQKCGTHLASMYPQWARYKEDPKEWRAPPKPKKRRVIKKSNPLSPQEILAMKAEMLYAKENLSKVDAGVSEMSIAIDLSDLSKSDSRYVDQITGGLKFGGVAKSAADWNKDEDTG